MFSRILIANRGEIALRIIRACREMGIESVVVYSKADANAIYLRYADHAICVGAGPSCDSYLNIPNIISAAEIADVQAIHPGFGFLAENPQFARICEDCNIKFIGPNSTTIAQLGDKSAARKLAKANRVPVIPGSEDPIETEEEAIRISHEIGFPVILKAAAGGGGRGMRIAHNDISLKNSYYVARQEAEAAFKDPRVYIEKYLVAPRHVEVQILADEHGNIVHLGERDCSIQRRHQKLMEESPCPSLPGKLREEICRAALRVAKAANYTNAGTVEFLVDRDNNFYFIEMNARLQVEHPVTEMVTGIDIVKQQIRIASGEKLPFRQSKIRQRGAALECRINAEDPENNFSPSPGEITRLVVPGGLGVRLDTHIYQGYKIPPYYDAMIGKLIVHADTRAEAIECMRRALSEFIIEGIKTTIPLYLEILDHNRFRSGDFDTEFLESYLSDNPHAS